MLSNAFKCASVGLFQITHHHGCAISAFQNLAKSGQSNNIAHLKE
jgi:hypothetical protein